MLSHISFFATFIFMILRIDHHNYYVLYCHNFPKCFLKYKYRQIAPQGIERQLEHLARLLRRRERCVLLLWFTLDLLLFNSFPNKKNAYVKNKYMVLAK